MSAVIARRAMRASLRLLRRITEFAMNQFAMVFARADRERLASRFAVLTAICAFVLVVSGNIVRVTQAGLACNDWPLCFGQVLPFALPADGVFADVAHRALSVLVGVLTAVLAIATAVWSLKPAARLLAWGAVALVIAQVLIGAALVRGGLEPLSRTLHMSAGLAVFGCLAGMPIALALDPVDGVASPAVKRLRRSLTGLAVLTMVVMSSGSVVSSHGAALACGASWPLCNGGLLPNGGPLVFWQWAHRTLSVLILAHVVSVVARARKPGIELDAGIWRALYALLAGFVVQAVVGAAMVMLGRPAVLSTLHSAVSALAWCVAVWLALAASRLHVHAPEPTPHALTGWRQVVADYVTLTKPKVVSLLLFTTIATMFVTPRGAPPWYLVFWTSVAGYLMVGAANAYNMWYDRDIDARMGRTSLRPIPSGRISPRQALIFSAVLLMLSLLMYVLFVNVMAAAMALLGFIYYTLIYTSWLKRSTWQNIVIGGGAGAIPPLIGWAAATGSLSWAALFLFFIIFYWTPPHFWALAIMKKRDYENAGVPMLPVVSTDAETLRQMLVYSVGMVALTLAMVPFGYMGGFYLVGATLLGALFIYYAWRALRTPAPKQIWGMYGYSLLYLALLFAVMIVDRIAVI
jgi:protoheme IX farnesyltransferase